MKTTPEGLVRKEVIDYLRKRGHLVLPHRTEAGINPRTGARLAFNENYATRGESDLMVAPVGRTDFIFMELKRKGKRKLDPDQILFKDTVELLGHEYVVVNCKEDCIALGL